MEARNCPRCGKVFTFVGRQICDNCYRKEEEDFQKLKNYIEDNPNCTMQELSEANEVSIKRILGFIRQGRLEISKGMHGEIKCEYCGRPITTGHYCDTCIIEINHNVDDLFKDHKNMLKAQAESKGLKMHSHPKKL